MESMILRKNGIIGAGQKATPLTTSFDPNDPKERPLMPIHDSSELPILLLDLNYTLAENSRDVMLSGYQYRVSVEEYRPWLRDLIQAHHVILITVRPERYKRETLARIGQQLGWAPNEAYFNEWGYRAPQTKQTVLEQYVFPKHGRDTWYLAIESNDRTAEMYANYGIDRYRAKDVQASPHVLLQRPH